MESKLPFQSFPDLASAQHTAALPEQEGIPVELVNEDSMLDSNFTGQNFSNPFRLKIPGRFAIVIGWNLLHFKRTLSDGPRVHYFNSSSRLQGRVLLGLAWGIFLLRIIQAIILS